MQRIVKSMALGAFVLGAIAPNAFATDFIDTFNADVLTNSNTVVTQAGSTPDKGVTDFKITKTDALLGTTAEQVKNIRVDLPPGLISNPEATPKCTQAQ